MRYFLLVLIIFPLSVFSQDCKLNRDTDPFTKQVKLSSGFIQLENAQLTVDADKAEIDLFFALSGVDKCFDNSSNAAIYFAGTKTKMNVRNGGSMNCDGNFHFTYKNSATTNTLLNKLATQKLAKIVFTGNNKKETTLEFSSDDQEVIMKFINCVINEAKGLL